MEKMTLQEWKEEGIRRFGENTLDWKFVCPSCGYIASVRDWKETGAKEGEVAFSCIGRHLKPNTHIGTKDGGPCNYAGGGLFRLNPQEIVEEDGQIITLFAFAD